MINGQGVECLRGIRDNGPAYASQAFAKACRTLWGLRHIRTGPYPRMNGKAEGFIQTLCREKAYAMPIPNSEEHNRYLAIYNRLRKHSALEWRSPQQRLAELLR